MNCTEKNIDGIKAGKRSESTDQVGTSVLVDGTEEARYLGYYQRGKRKPPIGLRSTGLQDDTDM